MLNMRIRELMSGSVTNYKLQYFDLVGPLACAVNTYVGQSIAKYIRIESNCVRSRFRLPVCR